MKPDLIRPGRLEGRHASAFRHSRSSGRFPWRMISSLGTLGQLLIVAGVLPLATLAQPFTVEWERAGAGGGESSAGAYRLRGSAGQAEADVMAAGTYRVRGGFWPGLLAHGSGGEDPGSTTLVISPASGAPGTGLSARATVPPGSSAVALYWDQGGTMRQLILGRPGTDGTLVMSALVPETAAPGPARLAVFPTGGVLGRDLVWADFQVVAPAPASISGIVQNAAGASVGAGFRVRLRDERGQVLREMPTDAAGRYAFAGLLPGRFIVEPLADEYPPETKKVSAGEALDLVAKPFPVTFNFPPVMLMGAGAIALPGGSYQDTQVVRVGDWTEDPFARLLSLQGKGRPPLTVRMWAEVKRVWLAADWALSLVFRLVTQSGDVIAQHEANTAAVVGPDQAHNFPAYSWDVNSFELPPGKLRWRVTAMAKFLPGKAAALQATLGTARASQPSPGNEVIIPGDKLALIWQIAEWEFPVEVVGLGERWFSSTTKNQKLTVTQKSVFDLLYKYEATLPNLPGFGTPLFNSPLDVKFKKLENRFDLGVQVKETFSNDGAWSGSALAKAELTLFDQKLIGDSHLLSGPYGFSLPASTYSLSPFWQVPLPVGLSIPVWGGGLPEPITICGQKFGGKLGVFLELAGGVSLSSDIDKNHRLKATVSPSITVSLPAEASLELGVCSAGAKITPSAQFAAPIVLDPLKNPPIGWEGLCVTLAATASAWFECCEIDLGHKSINLFDPVHIGNCPAAMGLQGIAPIPPGAAPPPHASVAVSPLGFAVAVWDGIVWRDGVPGRTAPLFSFSDGSSWSKPAPIAGEEFAGWEPQVAFIGPGRVLVTWVHPRASAQRMAALNFHEQLNGGSSLGVLTANPGIGPQGVCSEIADALSGILCSVIGLGANVVGAVGDFFGFAPEDAVAGGDPGLRLQWQPPAPVTDDDFFDLRPVLAGDPDTGEALLVWLREQEFRPAGQPLALYQASYSNGRWSAPARLDPRSNALDLQPSVRFDRTHSPAVVWMRDDDADLDTAEDRQLFFSRRGQTWSVPEAIPGLPESPWTPSLDFDTGNRPAVAFVVPPVDPATRTPLPADGQLSELHLARLIDQGWVVGPVGANVRAERPVLRINRENTALVMFRSFGSGPIGLARGEIAIAVADLAAPAPVWSVGHLTSGRSTNRRLAADLDPQTGEPVLVWVTSDPLRPEAEALIVLERRSSEVDLSFGEEGIAFSNAQPNPGETVEISVPLVNRGFRRFENMATTVQFFDREPARGVVPVASQTFRSALGFGESARLTVTYAAGDRARRSFYVVVDPDNQIVEGDESNNTAAGAFGGLPAPENFTAAALPSGNSVRLEWSSAVADGSVRHWIWRALPDRGWDLLGSTTGSEFTDVGATPGATHLYQVVTGDSGSDLSSVASHASASLPPVEPLSRPEPVPLRVTSFGGGVHLFWNALPAVQLQVADALTGASTVWAPVTEDVREVGPAASFSQPLGPGTRFFRLMRN